MAFRDLTSQYKKLRSYYTRPMQHTSSDSYDLEDEEFSYMNPSPVDLENPENRNGYTLSGIPDFVSTLNIVREDMTEIKRRMTSLEELHKEHITPRFGKDFVSEEHQIEIQTDEIQRLFKQCKSNIETLETSQPMKSQQDLMRKNLKMSLVTELNEISKNFRTSQKNYLQKLRSLKSRRKEFTPIEDPEDLDPEERERIEQLEQKMYDPGFSELQIQEMIQNEKDILRRDREIREILRSIIELQELFKEFSTLVIEQGTMLDRIDYNIEQTHSYIKDANKDLDTAEKYQKFSRYTLCIMLLLVAIVGVILVIVLRLVLKFALGGIL